MAKSNKTEFQIYRGDTKTWKFTFPYDITGMVFTFAMKEDIEDISNVNKISLSTTAGDNPADDIVNGIVHITLPSDVSSKLTPATYYYGFQRVIPGTPDNVRTLLVGKMEVLADVTQN